MESAVHSVPDGTNRIWPIQGVKGYQRSDLSPYGIAVATEDWYTLQTQIVASHLADSTDPRTDDSRTETGRPVPWLWATEVAAAGGRKRLEGMAAESQIRLAVS